MLAAMSEATAAGWMPDPRLPDRLRYWDGDRWTEHVSENGVQSVDPLDSYQGVRWQYAIIQPRNVKRWTECGPCSAHWARGLGDRAMYDKQSNWMTGMEKGFVLLKRPVSPGVTVADDEWCVTISLAGKG